MAKKKKTETKPREMTRRQISAHRRQQRRQRFIFFGGISIIAVIVLVVVVGWLITDFIPLNRTVIEVRETKFNTADFIGYMQIMALDQLSSGQSEPNAGAIASNAATQMPRGELVRQAAELLGITVDDQDIEDILKNAELPVNEGSKAYIRSFLLRERMNSDYFGPMVPESDSQVWSNAMLLESDVQATEIRNQLVAGENFTTLAAENALNYYSKNINSGDFGWHPREVLRDQLGSDIPTDFALTAKIGAVSEPLYDPDMNKQLGYWLIRVNEILSEDQANVDALLVSSRALAEQLKPQLEASDNISPLADEYTNYFEEKHGYLGNVNKANMTDYFNGYVFSDNVVLREWSDPIVDEVLWTKGGSWIVKVVDKADDRGISDEDREYLIGKRSDEWNAELDAASAGAYSTDGLTDDLRQLAIDRVTEFIEERQG